MSENLYLLSLLLFFGTIVLAFGMKYLAAVRQARSRVLVEDAYRELAEKAVEAQSKNASSLAAIQAEITQIKTRLATIEEVLKAVE
jgi:hypothetical protein